MKTESRSVLCRKEYSEGFLIIRLPAVHDQSIHFSGLVVVAQPRAARVR